MSSISERLKDARIAAGFSSASAAARAIGVPVPTYSHHENGNRELDVKSATAYGQFLKVSPAFLLFGINDEVDNGARFPEDRDHEIKRISLSEAFSDQSRLVENGGAYVAGMFVSRQPGILPEIDVQVGAGEGTVGEVVNLQIGEAAYSGHRIIGEWAFPEGYLRSELNASTNRTLVMQVVGDSMEPTYRPGDRVLVDISQNSLTADTVYVISDGESAPRIKRLVEVLFSRPRRVKIISDNPANGEQEVSLADVSILGRVVGLIGRR